MGTFLVGAYSVGDISCRGLIYQAHLYFIQMTKKSVFITLQSSYFKDIIYAQNQWIKEKERLA